MINIVFIFRDNINMTGHMCHKIAADINFVFLL